MVKKYKNDIIVITALLIIAVIITIVINIYKKEGKYASISIKGEVVGVYSLEEDMEITFDTGNHVVISNSKISVTDSECPDKICVNKGEIYAVGDTIVCLPNEFVIEIIKK